MPESDKTARNLQACVDRLRAGDASAREDLIGFAYEQLQRLASSMLRRFPSVRRWEMTDDVVQTAAMKLHRALAQVHPESVRAFFGLAATQIRRVLTDMWRHHYGPQRPGAHHATAVRRDGQDLRARQEELAPAGEDGPATMMEWRDFHTAVENLPPDQREAFDLLYYSGLSQSETAELLGVSERTVKRRWRSARLALYDAMQGQMPGS